MNTPFKLALGTLLVAGSSLALAANESPSSSELQSNQARQERMDQALQNYRSGTPAMNDERSSTRSSTMGTEESTAPGTTKSGANPKRDARKAGHAIAEGARKAGHAVHEAGKRLGGTDAPPEKFKTP